MGALGAIGGIFSFAGSLASAQAQQEQADALEYEAKATVEAADYNAKQEDRKGQEQRASAQRSALDDKEKGQYLQSTLQSYAAASGGGAADPTVVQLGKTLAGRTEYNALSQMWTGESQAIGLENQANLDRFVGRAKATALEQEAKAKRTAADATILGGVGGLIGGLAKFG